MTIPATSTPAAQGSDQPDLTETEVLADPGLSGRSGLGGEPKEGRRTWLLRPYRHLPPWIAVTQVFFGLGWLRAVGEKVIAIDWWTGDVIRDFVLEHRDLTMPWMEPIVGSAVVPLAPLVAVVIVVAQLTVGFALVANRAVIPALIVASTMNLTFLAVGAVNPSAFYLVGQGAVVLWYLGQRPPSVALRRGLQLATADAVALGVISAPFIRTIHPAEVIDDPAVMFVLLAGLTALAAELTHRAQFRRGLP